MQIVSARSQNDLIVCAVYTGTFGSSRVFHMACVICHNCVLNALCAIVAMIFCAVFALLIVCLHLLYVKYLLRGCDRAVTKRFNRVCGVHGDVWIVPCILHGVCYMSQLYFKRLVRHCGDDFCAG